MTNVLKTTSCNYPPDYPFEETIEILGGRGNGGWHDNEEYKLDGLMPTDDVYPDACTCTFHEYKGLALGRVKGSEHDGNVIDPHVRFHRGSRP